MYCRGENTRRDIIKDYELHPIAHVQLLPGQEKKSCTGDDLTNAYYCFSYRSRKNSDEGTILCGKHAAEDFLQLIKHPKLPLFNPLSLQNNKNDKSNKSSNNAPQVSQLKWNPTAKQLHDAIHLLVVCWSSPPGRVLGAIKSALEQSSNSAPTANQVKAINTILGKDAQKRTLATMVADIALNNSIKKYDFGLLDAVLKAANVSSNFT
jgi:hypothetical protein